MGGAGWGCWLVGARDERRGVVCGEGCEMWVGGFVVGRIYVCGCGEG